MSSAPVRDTTPTPDRWGSKLRFCFLGVHLLGVLTAVIGYRLWVYPAQERLWERQREITAAGGSMMWNHALSDTAERQGQKDFARDFAAKSFDDGMTVLSPRLVAYTETVSDYNATGKSFAVLYTAAAIVAIVGLIGCIAVCVNGSRLRCAAITAVVGLFWGGAAGLLFDCFPFSTFSDYRSEPWGAIVGAVCSATIGGLAGVLTAALARYRETKPEANQALQPTRPA
jgi:hypothetical protein